jgi:uncharacterized membrane protein YcgQ (UPF0703/DUF1980 family)
MDIPVYLFAGFLDGGKTTFINGVLQDGFALQDRTLLICCEEGTVEYDPKALRNVTVVTVDEEEDLTRDFLKRCEKKHRPKQVLVEFNGMWSMGRFYQDVLPNNWVLYQIMTMVEASTFDMYAKNLGQMMMEKLTNADMIVFNRCDEALRTALRQRNLRMVNRRASIYLENTDGTGENYADDTVCPFDLTQDVIDIPDGDFGVWYVDVMEHPERYEDKAIHARTVVCHLPQYPGEVILGRFAMTCCENDITFLGLVARGGGFNAFESRDWVDVTGTVHLERHKAYQGDDGPVLYVTALGPAEKPSQEVLTF